MEVTVYQLFVFSQLYTLNTPDSQVVHFKAVN